MFWKWGFPPYYEKRNFSEEKIIWICFFSSLLPLIYTAGYINYALKYHNFITWTLILIFLLFVFHGDALLHLVFSGAYSVPTIIKKVYVQPKSWFYAISCFFWIAFLLLKFKENFYIIYEAINAFVSNNLIENISINLISWGENDASGMLFLITPVLLSYVLEKYLVGVSNKKQKSYICEPGTTMGRILYPVQMLFYILILFILPPIIYFYIYIPLIGKMFTPIFTFIGFQGLLRTFFASGVYVIIISLMVFIVEWVLEGREKVRRRGGI